MPRATLITGAAGFAGSHLVDLLTDSRASPVAPVVGWYRPGGTAPAPSASAVKWEAVDLLDRSAVLEAIARLRPAIVYHCAGEAHVGQAWESTEATFAINVRGTHHLVDALCRAGAEVRMLVPGSALVYQPAREALTEDDPLIPTSPYGVSKLAQELLGRHTSTPAVQIVIARAFNHFGPRQDSTFSTSGFARQIAEIEAGLKPPEIAVGNLDARRDLTDVRDTVRAYRAIAERGRSGRAYNVCSGHAVAIRDVLDMLIARAGVPIRVHVDSRRFRPNDVPLLLGDPSRLRNELQWAPTIPVEQTVDDILKYWRGEVR
jgi:GDP-4-dehydro-6-deoxy-D-mannose reductase